MRKVRIPFWNVVRELPATKLFEIKILPATDCAPSIFWAFPANSMIPENRGGRGYPKSPHPSQFGNPDDEKFFAEISPPEKTKAARRPPSPYPTKPAAILRSRQRAVLEVILQNPRRQRRTRSFSSLLHSAHDLSAAYDFRRGESGNFLREHEIDFQ